MADDVLASELLNDLTSSFFAAGAPPPAPPAPVDAEPPLEPPLAAPEPPPVDPSPQGNDGWVDTLLSEPAVDPASVFAAVHAHLVRCFSSLRPRLGPALAALTARVFVTGTQPAGRIAAAAAAAKQRRRVGGPRLCCQLRDPS